MKIKSPKMKLALVSADILALLVTWGMLVLSSGEYAVFSNFIGFTISLVILIALAIFTLFVL